MTRSEKLLAAVLVVAGVSHFLNPEFFDPIVRSLFPIPGIAWIPLAILWFGLGNSAVIFVVCMAEFFHVICTGLRVLTVRIFPSSA